MVEGDVSDLADDAWGAILGGGDQPPMSPADVRAVFSDDILREARAKKPKNLLAVMLRALERAEAALEPDAPKEGAPALGAPAACSRQCASTASASSRGATSEPGSASRTADRSAPSSSSRLRRISAAVGTCSHSDGLIGWRPSVNLCGTGKKRAALSAFDATTTGCRDVMPAISGHVRGAPGRRRCGQKLFTAPLHTSLSV